VVVPGPGAAPAGAASSAQSGPVSLGSATVEQLDQIDGIGPVTAQKIVEFRDQHGGLSSIEQLDEVDGIGPATMQTLRSALQP
jgi:competence protein ComEA